MTTRLELVIDYVSIGSDEAKVWFKCDELEDGIPVPLADALLFAGAVGQSIDVEIDAA